MRKLAAIILTLFTLTGCKTFSLSDTSLDHRTVSLKIMIPIINATIIDYQKTTEGLSIGKAAIEAKDKVEGSDE